MKRETWLTVLLLAVVSVVLAVAIIVIAAGA